MWQKLLFTNNYPSLPSSWLHYAQIIDMCKTFPMNDLYTGKAAPSFSKLKMYLYARYTFGNMPQRHRFKPRSPIEMLADELHSGAQELTGCGEGLFHTFGHCVPPVGCWVICSFTGADELTVIGSCRSARTEGPVFLLLEHLEGVKTRLGAKNGTTSHNL